MTNAGAQLCEYRLCHIIATERLTFAQQHMALSQTRSDGSAVPERLLLDGCYNVSTARDQSAKSSDERVYVTPADFM